jgi:hypothetical protein
MAMNLNLIPTPTLEAEQFIAPPYQGQQQPMQQPMQQTMQQPMQQPQGLLGRIGSGIKRSVQDPNFMDRLTIGLGGMSMRPDKGLMSLAQNRILQRDKLGLINEQKNRTIEALKRLNTPQAMRGLQLLDAGGSISDALSMAFEKPKSNIEYKIVDGSLVKIDKDANTVSEIYSSGADHSKNIIEARKEFTALPTVKSFADVSTAYSRVLNSAKDPSGAGDLSLIFNFMKVLDPGSTVREGEFATAQNSGGVEQKVVSLYNQVLDGTRLGELQRADFVDRATRLYQGAEKQYNSIARQYAEFARQARLDPQLVIPDFSFQGEMPPTATMLRVPPNPDTSQFGTAEEWKNHWINVFTEEQRQQYLEE